MAKKEQQPEVNRGQVVIFGDLNYKLNDKGEFERTIGDNRTCEVLDVEEIKGDKVITYKHSLPLRDASIYPGPNGMVYCYNASLPYLEEVSHLAQVEVNTIMEQLYTFAGRTNPKKSGGFMQYFVIGILTLIAIVGILK